MLFLIIFALFFIFGLILLQKIKTRVFFLNVSTDHFLASKRKFLILFSGICLIILSLGLVFLKLKNFHIVLAQEQLSCTVQNSPCSGDKPVEIFQMSNTTNAHAALPGQSYNYHVCCGGITGLGNSCSGNYAVVLKLSRQTNAHVEQAGSYPQNACISAPSGNTISVAYRSGSCNSDEVNLASMSGSSNAHIGNSTAYTTKICVKIAPSVIVSVSVSDGRVEYGIMRENTSRSTLDLNDKQTAKNDGNVTENFYIRGQNATGGGCTWILASNNGPDQYVHQFCNASDNNCSSPPQNYLPLSTNYQLLKANVPVNGEVGIHLRLTTPTSSSCYGQQSVDVTIMAEQS